MLREQLGKGDLEACRQRRFQSRLSVIVVVRVVTG